MSRRDLAVRIAGGAVAVFVLAWFAYANTGERVDVDFVLFTLRDVSLPTLLYTAVILGMLVILGVGLRADLRLRRQLRERDWRGLPEGDSQAGAKPATSVEEAEVGGKPGRS
jgi:uncharacterized integral membrane protein